MSAIGEWRPTQLPPGPPMQSGPGRRSSPLSWRWIDRLALVFAWTAGIGLCLIAGAIVIYMGYRGIQYLRPSLLVQRPALSTTQSGSGGFLDPLIGTALLTVIGLARAVESSIEIVAGTPDIVIALFGLSIFQLGVFAPLSFKAAGGGVFGKSFIAAGAMMSLIALPPLFTATRDGLEAVPAHVREAAFALGKTRIATIRRVLLPS